MKICKIKKMSKSFSSEESIITENPPKPSDPINKTKKLDKSNSTIDLETKNDINLEGCEDKFKFIKDCIKRVEKRKEKENIGYNDLKIYENTYEAKINELKKNILELTRKIDEVRIAKTNVDKQIRMKEVFVETNYNKNKNKNLDGVEDELKNDIQNIGKEIDAIKSNINNMAEESIDLQPDIEKLKINIDEVIKNNNTMRTENKNKGKKLTKIILENKKLKDSIRQQEINSHNFLKEIEKMANKKSEIKYDPAFQKH